MCFALLRTRLVESSVSISCGERTPGHDGLWRWTHVGVTSPRSGEQACGGARNKQGARYTAARSDITAPGELQAEMQAVVYVLLLYDVGRCLPIPAGHASTRIFS